MGVTYTEVHDGQVYVYVAGQLVMKRWLGSGQSKVFYQSESAIPTKTYLYSQIQVYLDGKLLEYDESDAIPRALP